MTIAAIMQPTFFPWMGYFDMIEQADCFVLYDDVQLAKRSWQVRNRIKSSQGELFLTIPVRKTKTRDELLIYETEISYDENWKTKHLKTIESAYGKTVFFKEVFEFISNHYASDYKYLGDFNSNFIISVAKKIGISTNIIRSSELDSIEGSKDQRLASICKKINADTYLSAQGSAEYIEFLTPGGELTKQGIALYYHFYNHPVYLQLTNEFLPYMSILDALFNLGFDESLPVIRSGRQAMVGYREFRKKYLEKSENGN